MAANTLCDESALRNDRISIHQSLNEVLGLICYFHNNKDTNRCDVMEDKSLQFSIHVKKKSEMKKKELDVFTIKVKCNQCVPILSSLKELTKLIDLVGDMQKYEEESHLALRLPDNDDPSCTRTFVLWISPQENSTSFVQIQKETLSQNAQLANENLVLQLRIFMKTCELMDELQCLSRLLCSFKMLNPLVGISLRLEGICGEELDLCNNGYFPCDSLMMSTDSKLYKNERKSTDDAWECDMSLLKAFYGRFEDLSFTVDCGLTFVPSFYRNNSHCKNRSMHVKLGDINIQIYDSNRQPLDMLEFCLRFRITPDNLIPSNSFKTIMRIIGTSCISPYSMGCSVKVRQDPNLPQFIAESDRFSIWLCYVLKQDLSQTDFIPNGILNSLEQAARTAFQKFFCTNERTDPEEQFAPCSKDTDHEDSTKRWITDIASTLSDIYTKSTDISFRAQVAQNAPVHTRMSMKDYLQESLETILFPNKGSHAYHDQPPGELTEECTKADDEWKELHLSQFSSNEDGLEGSMSPDSLDMNDYDWNDNESCIPNLHKNETRQVLVSVATTFDLSDQNERSDRDEVTAESFATVLQGTSQANILQEENSCAPLTHRREVDFSYHKESIVQNHSTIRSIPSTRTLHNSCSNASKDSLGLDSEPGTAVWITDKDFNEDVDYHDGTKFEFSKAFDHNKLLTGSNFHHEEYYDSSKYSEKVHSMKRSNVDNVKMDADFKKVKMEDNLIVRNGSMVKQFDECGIASRRNTMNASARSCGDMALNKDNTEISLDVLQSAEQRMNALTRDEQTVPGSICSEENSEEWFHRDESSSWWCADLQD